MTVWAVAMVKNEIDCIEYNIDWLLSQVDNILIADNVSTDGTYELLLDKAHKNSRITVVQDTKVEYHHGEKMNELFQLAKTLDDELEWLLPFDADEFFFCRNQTIKEVLNQSMCDVIIAPVWHMVSKVEGEVTNPLAEIQWRKENPEKMPVVIFRWHPELSIHIGNHGVDWPNPRIMHGLLEVKHFQYRSLPQFIRKIRNGNAVLNMANFDQGICAHWREYNTMDDSTLETIWNEWKNEPGLIFDPWQFTVTEQGDHNA